MYITIYIIYYIYFKMLPITVKSQHEFIEWNFGIFWGKLLCFVHVMNYHKFPLDDNGTL